jgi:hypothetical protein
MLAVHGSKDNLLDGGKKYEITFPSGQLPAAGAFWSVTVYQDIFLVLNSGGKYAVSSWMNPKTNKDGLVTIYLQLTSPGADLELNWLPTSESFSRRDSAVAPLLGIARGSECLVGRSTAEARQFLHQAPKIKLM